MAIGTSTKTRTKLLLSCAAVLLTGIVVFIGALAIKDKKDAPRQQQNVLQAPSAARIDSLLQMQLESMESEIPVLIRGSVSRQQLEAAGVIVGTQAGGITTAVVPKNSFPALLALSEVEQISASNPLELMLDVSVPETEVATVRSGTAPNYTGLTGRDVIIGIVDTGIDLNHPDFRTSTNQTRIQYLWDQTYSTIAHPPGFSYGTEYTKTQINAGIVNENDTDGHGTHMAGIAAGNGQATGNGRPAYRYIGVAPEADLVVVKANAIEGSVIDGANYVFQKAAALGKDAVVLVAFGDQIGAHDGSSDFDRALSALTGSGKIIVAAAGNDGGKAIHSRLDLPNDGSDSITLTIPTYIPNAGEILSIGGWHESSASFEIRLTGPTGFTTGWVLPGNRADQFGTDDGSFGIQNALVTSSKGAKQIAVYMWDHGDGKKPRVGTWTIDVKRSSGTQSGVLDAWITNWRFGGDAPVFASNLDMTDLVASPATGDSILSAGAYTTKTTWTSSNGGHYSLFGNNPMWQLAPFSSPGPRRDGVQRPDITAPGNVIASAFSASSTTSVAYRVEDGVHLIRQGTSASAAHLAGVVALLLQEHQQEQQKWGPEKMRAEIIRRARSDSYTGTLPNGAWGAGKLSLRPVAAPPSRCKDCQFENPSSGGGVLKTGYLPITEQE